MNILLFCDEYPPGPHGGIGTAVQTLARELVRQGHGVWVAGLYDYGYGGADYEEDHGVHVYRLRKKSEQLGITLRYNFYDKVVRRLLSLTGQLEREVAEGLERLRLLVEKLTADHQIQIAETPEHQHYTRQVKKPVFFPEVKVPLVARLHGGNVYLGAELSRPVGPAALAIEKDLLSRAAAISSVSRYAAGKTLSLLGLEKEEARVIPNGIEVPPWIGFEKKDPQQVMFTGSLQAGKGVFQLMDAWNQVHEAWPLATLHLYGKGDTAAIKALLKPGAAETVFFHGHQPRSIVWAALQSAAIGVFPSFAETFALAPMEAMACGVATVYTQRTSGPELIDSGKNGLLIDPTRPSAIAGAILQLLRDKSLREGLARSGYEKIAFRYAIEGIAAQHVLFYNAVWSKGSGLLKNV